MTRFLLQKVITSYFNSLTLKYLFLFLEDYVLSANAFIFFLCALILCLCSVHFADVLNQVSSEPARVIETLQLFPIKSFDESGAEKLRFYANEYCCKESARSFTYTTVGAEVDRHPPLDLRLSFL